MYTLCTSVLPHPTGRCDDMAASRQLSSTSVWSMGFSTLYPLPPLEGIVLEPIEACIKPRLSSRLPKFKGLGFSSRAGRDRTKQLERFFCRPLPLLAFVAERPLPCIARSAKSRFLRVDAPSSGFEGSWLLIACWALDPLGPGPWPRRSAKPGSASTRGQLASRSRWARKPASFGAPLHLCHSTSETSDTS